MLHQVWQRRERENTSTSPAALLRHQAIRLTGQDTPVSWLYRGVSLTFIRCQSILNVMKNVQASVGGSRGCNVQHAHSQTTPGRQTGRQAVFPTVDELLSGNPGELTSRARGSRVTRG